MLWRHVFGWMLASLLGLPYAQAEISIARTYQSHPFDQAVNVGAGSYWVWSLPSGTVGDSYLVRVDAENRLFRDISAFIVDSQNLQRLEVGVEFMGSGRHKGSTPFVIHAQRRGGEPLYLVIDNRYSLLTTKKTRVSVTQRTQLNEGQVQALKDGLGRMYSDVKRLLVVPDFNIQVRPCNEVNASSERDTGNITLCSELLSKYEGNPAALTWVFMHELGHSALALWGIPGNDNEDMADEFATAMFLRHKDGAQLALKAMEFFKESNARMEAEQIIQKGGRHSLSIQRMRNITSWLLEPVRVTAKWNNLLYPKMTDAALKHIVSKPGPYENSKLAQDELARRALSGEGSNSIAVATSTPLGCTKDTDCKGNRICERGACINP